MGDILGLKERGVVESLFIEYKAHVPKDLGRRVAAFANTRGGWCILGVEADPDTYLPIEFPGISKNDWPLNRLINIVQGALDFMPTVHARLIDLDDQHAIAVINIEESPSPPHVYKDSRIYVRNPVGFDPIVEEDRNAINEMYEKAERTRTALEAAMDATLWRSRFQPRPSIPSETQSKAAGFHFSLAALPKMLKPNLIPVFEDEQFLVRNGFAHGGQSRRRQHSITMEDETRNHEKFTEISAHGLVELYIQTRFRPQDGDTISMPWVPIITNFMDRVYRIYERVEYFGPVLFLAGLSGIEGRSVSDSETGRRAGPSDQDRYEIFRDCEGGLKLPDTEKRAKEIEDEIYRCFGEPIT